MKAFHKLITLTAGLLLSWQVWGLDLELTQGMSSALPIGVASFGSSSTASEVSGIVQHDLQLSGQFKLCRAAEDQSVEAWRSVGADNAVLGRVEALGGGRYQVQVRLLDIPSRGKVLLTQDFQVSERELHPLAHHISDLVYEKLTGERGIFSTRIAYVSVSHRQGARRYSLEVADMDGTNPQSLFTSSEPIMSPAWSADGKQIACVSFENKRSQIYMIALATGHRRLVTSFPGINGAPAWSPDGRSMAVVLSHSGSPKVYQVDLNSGALKQLTFGSAIDTEPRFAPDGNSLILTSGRGGSPQVYRLNLQNGQMTRLTFSGSYNARATLTPNQSQLVMLHRDEQGFTIAAQNLLSGRLDILSSPGSALDESPSVSPNGRMVIYATREADQGLLEMASLDGRIHLRLPSKEGDVQEPAWSPFLG